MSDILHAVEGWEIRADHTSAFVRTFVANPVEEMETEYKTSERRGNRYIAAVYPARVIRVDLRWQWDEKKGVWWGSSALGIVLINERTNDRYKSGWREGMIRTGSYEERMPEYVDALMEAANPHTIITVTEVSS